MILNFECGSPDYVGEMRAPDRSAVAPNLLLQQVVFTTDLPRGQ
jgi:hypothetical protein